MKLKLVQVKEIGVQQTCVVRSEFGVKQRLCLGEFGGRGVVGWCIGDKRCCCGSSGDPDQAVEVEAKNKSTTLFSSRASGAAGYRKTSG